MLDHIVLDIEIAKCIGEDGLGWNDTDKLGMACCCLWEYRTGRMRVYGANDLSALKERIMKADRVTGFNIWKFDLPVIYGLKSDAFETTWYSFSVSLKSRTDDLLQRIWKALGSYQKGFGLGNVCKSTIRTGKIDDGANAPVLFQNGDWAKVVNYCADDVALTRDLSDYIDIYGGIHCPHTDRFIPIPPWR